MFTNHIYSMNMHKEDLALNNLQWLICHKTKLNKLTVLIILYHDMKWNDFATAVQRHITHSFTTISICTVAILILRNHYCMTFFCSYIRSKQSIKIMCNSIFIHIDNLNLSFTSDFHPSYPLFISLSSYPLT